MQGLRKGYLSCCLGVREGLAWRGKGSGGGSKGFGSGGEVGGRGTGPRVVSHAYKKNGIF